MTPDETRAMLRELLAEALAAGGNGNGGHRERSPAGGATAGGGAAPGGAAAGGGPAPGGATAGGGGAPDGTTPAVPAPPVAAVLRPSTWSQPPAPGEVIGDGWPAGADERGGAPRPTGAGAPGGGARPTGADGSGSAARAAGASAPGGARVEAVSLRSDADLARFVDTVLANAAAIRSGALRFTLGAATASTSGVRRIDKGAVTERTVNAAASAGQRLVLAPAAVLTPLARERARHLKVEIERERRC